MFRRSAITSIAGLHPDHAGPGEIDPGDDQQTRRRGRGFPGGSNGNARWTLDATHEQLQEGAEVPEGGFELEYSTGEPTGFLAGIGLREWGLEFCLGDQSGPAKKDSGLGRLAFYCPANSSIEVQQGETVSFISTREIEPPPPESVVAKVMKSVPAKLGPR
jgi:hypothetical protein